VEQLQTSGWYSLVMRYDFSNEFPSKMKLNMSNADGECDAGRQIQPKLPLRPASRLVAYKVVGTYEVFPHENE
jgi:hypothetical protein